MSQTHSGNIANSITQEEHRSVNGVNAKAVAPYGYDGTNLVPIKTDSSGRTVLSSGFVPESYDYIAFTTTSTTDVRTYKSGGSAGTTVATVTITYTDSTKTVVSNIART